MTRAAAILGAVLALQTADISSIGSLAVPLERDLQISHTQLGLLVTVSALVGAIATVPAGVVADRRPRVPLLVACTLLWSLALLAGAAAPDYRVLLLTRLGLGLVTAAAGPLIASLTGDVFPSRGRAEAFGGILAGELAGAGAGFLFVGVSAAVVGWRGAMALLGGVGLALPVVIRRGLHEPPRRPDDGAGAVGLGRAARTVLGIRTNVVLIVSSALGYFYLTGLQTFGLSYARSRFDVGQVAGNALIIIVGAGSLAGVLLGGRIADARRRAGHRAARVTVAAVATLAAATLLLPGLLAHRLVAAIPILMLAMAAVAASNPCLDAARLDVVPSALWGRAESLRVISRSALVAFAPVCFGLVIDALDGPGPALDAQTGGAAAREAGPITTTFLIMLAALALSGALLLLARRTYPRDAAATDPRRRALQAPVVLDHPLVAAGRPLGPLHGPAAPEGAAHEQAEEGDDRPDDDEDQADDVEVRPLDPAGDAPSEDRPDGHQEEPEAD